jgi:ubiquinone/menaquinone biosynthesis C-methylase UbiE
MNEFKYSPHVEKLKVQMWEMMAERAKQVLGPKSNYVMLDIGKSGGATALAFSKEVTKVVAIDITTNGSKKLNEEIEKRHISNIEVIGPYDLRKGLPFEGAAFDIVTCRLILNQVDDVRGLLGEAHRVLKPNGKLGVAVSVLSNGIKDLWTSLTKAIRNDHKNDFTYLEIVQLIVSKCFEIQCIIPYSVPRSLNEKLNVIQDQVTKDRLLQAFLWNKERFAELRFRFVDDPEELIMLKKEGQPQWFHDFNIIEILAIKGYSEGTS